MQVLGNGAYRVAVDDLIRAVNEDKKVQTTFISHHNNPKSSKRDRPCASKVCAG